LHIARREPKRGQGRHVGEGPGRRQVAHRDLLLHRQARADDLAEDGPQARPREDVAAVGVLLLEALEDPLLALGIMHGAAAGLLHAADLLGGARALLDQIQDGIVNGVDALPQLLQADLHGWIVTFIQGGAPGGSRAGVLEHRSVWQSGDPAGPPRRVRAPLLRETLSSAHGSVLWRVSFSATNGLLRKPFVALGGGPRARPPPIHGRLSRGSPSASAASSPAPYPPRS